MCIAEELDMASIEHRQPQADSTGRRRGSAAGVLLLALLGCGDGVTTPGAPAPDDTGSDPRLPQAAAGSNGATEPGSASSMEPASPASEPLPPEDSTLPASLTAEYAQSKPQLAQLVGDVSRLRQLNATQLLSEFPVAEPEPLGYSPGSAEFLDLIQKSALALNDAELAVLEGSGFVISSRRQFPTFLRGYAAIYSEDLPVYGSADAILDAVHRSYDDLLSSIESWVLKGELRSLLDQWLARVGSIQ